MVRFLARTGAPEKAKAVIEQARRQLASDQAAPALARCYAELGEMDQARAQFRAALARKPDDIPTIRGAATFALASGKLGEAEADLLKIIDLKDQAPDDAAWARRLLATVLAAAGDHHRALELVGLADEGASYIPGPDEPAEELRARASVLAVRDNRVARRAAIRILEYLADREFDDVGRPIPTRPDFTMPKGIGPGPRFRSAACWPAIQQTHSTWLMPHVVCFATE